MVIQFTLQDLMIFLVCALAIAAGFLLLPTLMNIKKMVGILRPLLEANQELIKKTIKTIPGILENVEQISSNVKDSTDKLKISVPVILQDVESAAHAAKGSIELAGAVVENVGSGISGTFTSNQKDNGESTSGFMVYFPVIKDILQLILRAFSSDK